MDRRDDELLAKQMRAISPPHNAVGLALLAVFAAGLMLGAVLFAGPREPVRAARRHGGDLVSKRPN